MSGLTQAQAIAFVQQGLGWRSDKSAEITAMFDIVQYEELERGVTLPWFLVSEDQAQTGTANSGVLTLPTNFLRNIEDGGLYVTTTDGPRRYLVKRPMDWLINQVQDAETGDIDTGDPQWYALNATQWYCGPVPTTAWTAYANYYAHATLFSTLGSGAQNAWLQYASLLFTSLVGVRMAEDLQHAEALQKFQTRFSAASLRLNAEIALRETSDREIVMGNQA